MKGYAVAFDLETGGLDKERHPIIQLAAIAVDRDLNEIETFERKIRFDPAKCDPEALKVNSYVADVWEREAVMPRAAAEAFAGFLSRHASLEMISARTRKPYYVARLFGHNAASFDGPFLQAWFRGLDRMFLPADPRVRCTAQRAFWWFDDRGEKPENFKLATLCKHFGIPLDEAHDAFADVRATVALAKALRAPAKAVA